MDSNESLHCTRDLPCSEELNEFSYENALYKALEELRLKRKIEEENQKDIYDLLQQKYDQEKRFEEEKRTFKNEKTILEEQIKDLRKALEQKTCEDNCDAKNQEMYKKMFENEINCLRSELKSMHMVKLNLERKCQEFETEAKLHESLKEAAVKRINVIQQDAKELKTYQVQLKKVQSTLKENVEKAYSVLENYDLTNRHLCEIMSFVVKRNKFLSAELIQSQLKIKYIAAAASEESSKDTKSIIKNDTLETMNVMDFKGKVNKRHQDILEVLNDIRSAHQDLIKAEIYEKQKEGRDAAETETASHSIVQGQLQIETELINDQSVTTETELVNDRSVTTELINDQSVTTETEPIQDNAELTEAKQNKSDSEGSP